MARLTTGPFPASRKVYLGDPRHPALRVAMRESEPDLAERHEEILRAEWGR